MQVPVVPWSPSSDIAARTVVASATAPPGVGPRCGVSRRVRWLAVIAVLGVVLAAMPVQAAAATPSATMADIAERVGAAPMLEDGYSGAGVDVAVIDTGVEPVPGLDGHGKVVAGPDLSFEAGLAERHGRDSYGHGTVMASIIAGDGGPGGFQGIAPGSRVLSVKVADNTGAVDVSQVIAAIDWVIANGRGHGLNVRVINLSYVTDSDQSYLVDPLAHAVERAWRAGYVVVVAAGNHGGKTNVLGNPASDPYVVSVAAADDDGEAEFSNRGSKTRVPDILAPGDRVLGLAAPGSRLVQEHPEAFIDDHFLRGSGTSQATAVVSGAAALLLEQRPALTPDQVKALLIMGTVDDKGRGRVAELDPFKGEAEFFDELDRAAQLRAEARRLRTLAAEFASRGEDKEAEKAAEKAAKAEAKGDDHQRRADGARVSDHERHQAEAESLRAETAALREEAIALRRQAATIVADAAGLSEKEASNARKRADDLLKHAGKAEKDAVKADEKADKAADKAQHAIDKLERDIEKIFASWDGRGLGSMKFHDRRGAGLLDVERSAGLPTLDVRQSHPEARGTGLLEAARGSDHVILPNGSRLEGEVTFTGSSWSGSSWSGSSWSGSSWSGSSWSGSSWSGSSWSGSSWSGSSWSGSSWSGSSWSGSSWSGSSWSGARWR